MSIFQKKSRVKVKDPFIGQKTDAVNFLRDLMLSGTPNLPTQEIAGLTDFQNMIQSGIRSQYDNLNQSYGTARDYYNDVLSGGYDPRTSDYYKGLRQEASDLKTESTNDVRQGANLGGMLQSTPRMAVEAENRRKIDNQSLQLLGGLYENERGRMGQAAQGVQALENNQIAATSGLNAIADQERVIEQQRNNAIYEQALATVLFPYQQSVRLANSIFGSSPMQFYATGGQKNWVTDVKGFNQLGTMAAGAFAGLGGLGGGAGGGGITPGGLGGTAGNFSVSDFNTAQPLSGRIF